MAEEKKRGFGAFEKRVHELEEEEARKQRSTSGEEGARREEEKERPEKQKR